MPLSTAATNMEQVIPLAVSERSCAKRELPFPQKPSLLPSFLGRESQALLSQKSMTFTCSPSKRIHFQLPQTTLLKEYEPM